MKKIETIWHHLLQEALQNRSFRHTQEGIAQNFGYSLSTIHHALQIPTELGAIRKETKFFVLEDYKKLLYYWASVRNFSRDIIDRVFLEETMQAIEGLAIPESIFACYSAARFHLGEAPADYAKTYWYIQEADLEKARRRFATASESKREKREPNVFFLKMPAVMARYGKTTTLPQTFVDIWNLRDWYAKDFCKALEEKIDGLITGTKSEQTSIYLNTEKDQIMKNQKQIAPSILAADFARLGEEIRAVEAAGADVIHVDVMDGHFVPNITLGPDLVRSIRKVTKLPLDCHLMIEHPEKYIEAFAKAGADWISVHVEACDLAKVLPQIKKLGCKAGIVLNPPTPVEKIIPYCKLADFILVMTVNPGFAGQKMIQECIAKIKPLKKFGIPIEVDGGIKTDNIAELTEADIFVSGSGIFSTKDYMQTIKNMREVLE